MTIVTFTTTMGNQEGVDNINGAFDKTIGHAHDGSDMHGGIISYNDLKDKPTNMATADKLRTPRTINGVAFDGHEDIVINGGLSSATSAEAIAGTSDIVAITPLKLRNALNAEGDAPIFACRAWVNFNGVPLTGTYTQSGTVVTVTMTSHSLTVGDNVNLSITSGTGVSGSYVVATVPTANSFTYTAGTSLTTSGNITRNIYIRASGNVSSITDNGVGDYTINFTVPMIDGNYCPTILCGSISGTTKIPSGWNSAPAASSYRFLTYTWSTGGAADAEYINATFER